MEPRHDSVLVEEVIEALEVRPNDVVVDGTLGGAGHFGRLFSLLDERGVIVGIDADAEAIERTEAMVKAYGSTGRPRVELANDNFRNLGHILKSRGIEKIDKILLDLGWSGYQLAARRGFSFQQEEPLLMSYGKGGQSAAEIVNSTAEADLADLLYAYGEERFARGIARAIVAARSRNRILSTTELVDAVMRGTPAWYRTRKIHPATKTFQALRIATNDELGALREGLTAALSHLAPSGRIAVITFHSIEDRVVKNVFREASDAGLGSASKKPVTASTAELTANRRARSAKLRVFERFDSAVARSTGALRLPTYA